MSVREKVNRAGGKTMETRYSCYVAGTRGYATEEDAQRVPDQGTWLCEPNEVVVVYNSHVDRW